MAESAWSRVAVSHGVTGANSRSAREETVLVSLEDGNSTAGRTLRPATTAPVRAAAARAAR